MLQKVVVGFKCVASVLLILMMTGTSPLLAQGNKQPDKEDLGLSPQFKKSLDDAIDHLKSGLDAYNKKIRAIERDLFASPEKILDLCQSPMRPKKFRAVLNHFKATKGDPVSLPSIDCLFMKHKDGGARLWSYKPAKDKSYYMLRAHEGMTPNGGFVFARHPLNFHHRRIFKSAEWEITRSTFTPVDSFPLRANSTLTLTEQSEGEEPVTVTAKVVKSFPIVHQVGGQATEVETLHIVVKELAPKKLRGKIRELRRWYVYSQKANVFIERSHALTMRDSEIKAATGVSKDLSQLSYIKDGQYILQLSATDLAPLRSYLTSFDVWGLSPHQE